jgi:hypothetical protein
MKVLERRLEIQILDSNFLIYFEEKQLQWFGYIKQMNRIRKMRSTLILNFKEQSTKRHLSQALKEIKKKGNCREESERL